jgi:hypothetical protein
MRSLPLSLLMLGAFASRARADDSGPLGVGAFSGSDTAATLRSLAPITGDPCVAIEPSYSDPAFHTECKIATRGKFDDVAVELVETRVSAGASLFEIDEMLVLTTKEGAFAAPVVAAAHMTKTGGTSEVRDATAIITKLDAGILLELTFFQEYESRVKPGGGVTKFLGRVFMLCRTSTGNCTSARFGDVFDTCTTRFDTGGVRYRCEAKGRKPQGGRVAL